MSTRPMSSTVLKIHSTRQLSFQNPQMRRERDMEIEDSEFGIQLTLLVGPSPAAGVVGRLVPPPAPA